MNNYGKQQFVSLTLGLGLSAVSGIATPITFTGSGVDSASGNALSASATFNVVGNDLNITLQNLGTQPGDDDPSLYFNLNGTPALTPFLRRPRQRKLADQSRSR